MDEGYRLFTSYSDDLGIKWSKPLQVEEFNRRAGDVGVHPTIAITQDGIIGLIWSDHRTDENNKKYGIYFSYSLDAGETFSKSVR